MKHNPPANPFPDEVRALYSFEHTCWACGSNQGIELDHILGRISASPYNAFVICRKCHMKKGTKEFRIWQLDFAAQFLEYESYNPKDNDFIFLKQADEYRKP